MPSLGIMASSFRSAAGPVGAYDSLATVTVPSGGAASITFAGIPSDYKHLQIRAICRGTYATGSDAILIQMRVNSDTAANYSLHLLQGSTGPANGTSAQGYANADYIRVGALPKGNWTSGVFGPIVLDILDYANTNKYKTIRSLSGAEGNSASVYQYVEFDSASWRNTNAITSINIFAAADSIAEYSSFALYGVK